MKIKRVRSRFIDWHFEFNDNTSINNITRSHFGHEIDSPEAFKLSCQEIMRRKAYKGNPITEEHKKTACKFLIEYEDSLSGKSSERSMKGNE